MLRGHRDRIVRIYQEDLLLFANLFDAIDQYMQARLPEIHARQFVDVLHCFAQMKTIRELGDKIFTTVMFEETGAQSAGLIKRDVRFPEGLIDTIYSGPPHIAIANPVVKTSRRICRINSDYDNIDLLSIDERYLQRINYTPASSVEEYFRRVPEVSGGGLNIPICIAFYRAKCSI